MFVVIGLSSAVCILQKLVAGLVMTVRAVADTAMKRGLQHEHYPIESIHPIARISAILAIPGHVDQATDTRGVCERSREKVC